MSEEDATSSSSSQGLSESFERPSVQSVEKTSQGRVDCTTKKSVVFQLHAQDKVSSSENKRASTDKSTQTLLSALQTDSIGIADTEVQKTLQELNAEVECKKRWLKSEEEAFQSGQQRLSSLQQEHATLLRNLEQCKRRRKERICIQKMVQSPPAESGGSDSDRESESDRFSDSSSHKKRRRSRDGARKERKRLRRFQREVSLRFQLLESKCRESDLKVEKLVADLRREYTDSCLFGNSLNF